MVSDMAEFEGVSMTSTSSLANFSLYGPSRKYCSPYSRIHILGQFQPPLSWSQYIYLPLSKQIIWWQLCVNSDKILNKNRFIFNLSTYTKFILNITQNYHEQLIVDFKYKIFCKKESIY